MWPLRRRKPGTPKDPSHQGESSARELGQRGERRAAKVLKQLGMKVLARNYRCPAGEVDLIALDRSARKATGRDTLVFVEVKTRSSNRYTEPESAVDDDKRRRMRRVANYYLAARKAGDLNVRFDIVAILAAPGQPLEVRHLPGVYTPPP